MTCPKCGAESPENFIQCESCGELLHAIFGQTGVVSRESQTALSSNTATPEAPTEVLTPQEAPTRRSGRGFLQETEARSRELAPATLFGNRYQILGILGEGGMGKVYKALDKALDKIVALKIIRGEKGEDPEAIHRFKQELLLARKVTHKNVIRIHDLGEAEGVKYFTMEYVEGKSLKQMIHERGKISAEAAVSISKQVLSALDEAHRQGVIHRDMKPQNVMVDAAGVAFVMDFGIARAQDTTGLTATGDVVGTPDYMSPEQVRGEKADPQSDLFSFGVILYEMLTGELPYQAESAVSKVVMRLTQRPRSPREVNVDIPRYLEGVVLKCLDLDRALRYSAASEVLQDLERGQVDRSLVLKTQRAVSRHKGMVATAAVAVLAVAVAAYVLVRRSQDNRGVNARPAEVITLAILPFTNATGAQDFEWMRTGIQEMLVTDIGQSRFIRPVPGQRVYKVLEEIGALKETLLTEATLDSVLKRAPAQSVLSGQFVESGGKLRLDLTLRKAGSGITMPLRVETTSADVFGLVDQITRGVKGLLDLTPEQLKGDSDRPIQEVSSTSVAALKSYQAGLAELQRGAPLQAIPLLKEATEKDPEFAMALAKLAEAYFTTAQAQEAEAAIERAVALSERPDKELPLAERYQIHATAALIEENNEKAVASFRELANLYPDDPDIRMSLAGAYEQLGQLPAAIEAYERAVAMAPGYGAALLGLGRVQVMGGQPARAIVSLEKVLDSGQYEQDPESLGMIYSILGVACRETGDLARSIQNLDKSLELRKKTGDGRGQAATYLNLASVYDSQGEHRKAIDSYQNALTINRAMGNQAQVSRVLNNLAVSYREAGRLELALDTFKESLRIEMEREDHVNMANRLDHVANIYRLRGQYEEAIVYLGQAKAHLSEGGDKREQAINLEYFGDVRQSQGLFQEALAAYLDARAIYEEIHFESGLSDVQKALGHLYVAQGLYANAYEAFQQALSIAERLHVEHDIAEAKAPLGNLYVVLGRLDEAEKALDEAAHGHGGSALPSVLLSQAELERTRGRREEAAKLYAQAHARATRIGEKETAVASQVKLGRLLLEQRNLPAAEALLTRTRQDAVRARLRPLEAEANLTLAEVHLAKGGAEAARRAALETVSLADKYDGLPILYRGYAVLGGSLEKLGRGAKAVDAYASAAQRFERIRAGLRTEDVERFTARADVQAFLAKTTKALDGGGRPDAAAPLKKWLRP